MMIINKVIVNCLEALYYIHMIHTAILTECSTLKEA